MIIGLFYMEEMGYGQDGFFMDILGWLRRSGKQNGCGHFDDFERCTPILLGCNKFYVGDG